MLLLLGFTIFRFTDEYASVLPVRDRWHSLDPLFYDLGLWESFVFQHGSHRLGLIAIFFKLTYGLSSWNGRIDMFLQGLFYLLSAILALRLKFTLTGKWEWWDLLIPMIFINLQSASTFTINPYVHGLIPLFALSILICQQIKNPAMRILSTSLLSSISLFSGFAIVVGLSYMFMELIGFLRTRRTIHLVGLSLPVIALVYLISTQKHSESLSSLPELRETLNYLTLIAGNYFFLGAHSSLLPAGILMIVILASLLLMKRDNNHRNPAMLTYVIQFLMASSFMFYLLNLSGRADLPLENALSSRYIPASMPLIFALYLLMQSLNRRGIRIAFLTALSLIMLRFHYQSDVRTQGIIEEHKQIVLMERCLLENNYMHCEETTGYQLVPDPHSLSLQKKLDYMKENSLNIYRNL
jgi:hypothetical protein